MKKLTALLLALVMALAFSSAVLAEDVPAIDTPTVVNDTATTEVNAKLDAAVTRISATVPLKMTAVVSDASGTLVFPDKVNYTITNTSALPIKISTITATAGTNFSFTAEASNELKVTLNDASVGTTVDTSNGKFGNIANGASLELELLGNIGKFNPTILKGGAATAFTLTYTLALAD